MSEITLVRQHDMPIAPADKEAVRRVLFGTIDGLGDQGKRQWRRFFSGLLRLQPGELITIRTNKPRSSPFHRRHMAIEQQLFDAQERFEHFDQFRNWLKVGAGFVDWCAGPKGGVIPIPKSIAFDKLEDDEMRQVHEDMVAFLRGPHAPKYLWPALKDRAGDAMEAVLAEFNE